MPKGLEGGIFILSPLPNGTRTNSLKVDNISSSWQLNNKVKETLLRIFLIYLYQTIQSQQCLIQSDVEQLLVSTICIQLFIGTPHLLLTCYSKLLIWTGFKYTQHILSMMKLFTKVNGKLLVCLNTADTLSVRYPRAFSRYSVILLQYTFPLSSEYYGTMLHYTT